MGEDLTFDIVIKIENIVGTVCEKQSGEFEEILMKFFKSNTYKSLKNKESVLRTTRSEFIVNELFREWAENKIINSWYN
jgi:hypothetical protein